jgi:tRNA(Ile)-lysidine synthase
MQIPYPFTEKSPLTRFKEIFSQLQNTTTAHFYIAFSGGLDSHILLHATRTLCPHLPLTAIHINHGWHQDAIQWETHCQMICDQLEVPFINCNIAHQLKSESYIKQYGGAEGAARQARYAVLRSYLKEGDYLLTGHHLEDQAETLLLQLARGAGIQGLASMPSVSHLGVGYHIRPLLSWSHEERILYAQQHKLVWIEDSSNLDLRFNRNFIRHQVVPLLKQRWPHVSTVLARTAMHCAQANALASECAVEDLIPCQVNLNCLSIKKLLKLSYLRQRNALRYWLQQHIKQPLTTTQFIEVEKLIHATHPTTQFNLKNLRIRRYRDYLYALKANTFQTEPPPSIMWNWKKPLTLVHFGRLSAIVTHGKGIRLAKCANLSELEIRFRRGKERFRPKGRCGSHPLKKLFQEWNIPPWERPYIPLIYIGQALVAVPGYAIAEAYVATQDEPSLDIQVIRDM